MSHPYSLPQMGNLFISIIAWTLGWACMSHADRVYLTPHFKLVYTPLDDINIKEIADSLETSYPKITASLHSEDLALITVRFYPDIAELTKAFPDFPPWAVGQAISVSQIHMISPNDPKQDYQTMIRNTKHEFAHCVSLKINPRIANNPRWLWESVALYEANLPWDPRTLPYLVNQQPPSLDQLNDLSDPRVYEVGYFVAQFVVKTYGTKALRSLIQTNGDLKSSLRMTNDEFTRAWFGFVRKEYGL